VLTIAAYLLSHGLNAVASPALRALVSLAAIGWPVEDAHRRHSDAADDRRWIAGEAACIRPRLSDHFMTAFPSEPVRRRVMAAGARCYLSTPSDGDEIIRCLEQALARHASG